MSRTHAFALAIAFALAWLGCDPGTHVKAHVTSANECAGAQADPGRERPVEGALVTLRCADHETPLGKTGADGRLAYDRLGSLNEDCTLHVTSAGYLARTYRVGDVCATGLLSGHCPFVNLEPVLRPASAP